jgi:hypothetical protein
MPTPNGPVKHLGQFTELRRDDEGRILPSAMAPAHEAFQQLCEANSTWFHQQDTRGSSPAAGTSRESPSRFARLASPPAQPCVGAAAKNSRLPPASEPVTVFQSRTLPKLSLFELGFALNKSSQCGGDALMVALVLMWRYCVSSSTRPTAHMMHRLYVACLQVGMKAHSDVYYRNDAFARIAGVSLAEMNRLEEAVVHGLNWQLIVQPHEVVALVVERAPSVEKLKTFLRCDTPCIRKNALSLEEMDSDYCGLMTLTRVTSSRGDSVTPSAAGLSTSHLGVRFGGSGGLAYSIDSHDGSYAASPQSTAASSSSIIQSASMMRGASSVPLP